MSVQPEEKAGKAIAGNATDEIPTLAEVRRRAYSVPPASAEVPPSPPPVTERNRIQRAREGASKGAAQIAEKTRAFRSGPPVLSTAPASLAAKRVHHHEIAAHWGAPVVRYPRIAWGYLHLLIKALLHGTDWVTESPVRVAVAVAVYFICRIWI